MLKCSADVFPVQFQEIYFVTAQPLPVRLRPFKLELYVYLLPPRCLAVNTLINQQHNDLRGHHVGWKRGCSPELTEGIAHAQIVPHLRQHRPVYPPASIIPQLARVYLVVPGIKISGRISAWICNLSQQFKNSWNILFRLCESSFQTYLLHNFDFSGKRISGFDRGLTLISAVLATGIFPSF